ncbi:Glycoside hydrolase family 18, catalytic domain [Sesbania bispinosa]|nr:Glycoside hydrolase family 18, catalytic domain [Sesbania bispinosa]
MSSERQALILLLFSVLTLSLKSSEASIGVNWGQNKREGSLSSTCDSGNYDTVHLGYLNVFGCGRTPSGNFGGHCGGYRNPCTILEPQIQHCQQNGIKVFLSLGGPYGDYSLCSRRDAKQLANYLYNNFLSGEYGPLGSVTLDGIDLEIKGGSNRYWDDLANELASLKSHNNQFSLSVVPQCAMPDYYLDRAIGTGVFDDILVQFYNSPTCQYSRGNTQRLLDSWNGWASVGEAFNSTVYMGLAASPEMSPFGGYIQPRVLTSEVLPYIKTGPNYGGVMLWSRYYDVQNQYSDKIKPYLSNYVWQTVKEAISDAASAALHRILHKPYVATTPTI